jgi:hypothetical protein
MSPNVNCTVRCHLRRIWYRTPKTSFSSRHNTLDSARETYCRNSPFHPAGKGQRLRVYLLGHNHRRLDVAQSAVASVRWQENHLFDHHQFSYKSLDLVRPALIDCYLHVFQADIVRPGRMYTLQSISNAQAMDITALTFKNASHATHICNHCRRQTHDTGQVIGKS